MADSKAPTPPDPIRRMGMIERITELNSQYIRSEVQRGGLEVEITRCEEAIARGDGSEDFPALLKRLRREWAEIEQSRRDIDLERERLDAALNAPDG